ncbi:MAG: amino acid ABC transporter permease [Oscillospiraceae bacterium]
MNLANIVLQLSEGMLQTVIIFLLTLLFSMPLGLVVALARMSKFKPLALLAKIYISVLRGTPLMLQIMFVYFSPYYIFGISLSLEYRFIAVIIAFSINYAAYFAEIYRAGIESIPVGQYEAANVLGFTKAQTFFRIILPQVIKRIIPPVTNEIITLIKDTSLAFVISYAEMFTIAQRIAAKESNVTSFIVAAVFYYIFNLIVAVVMEKVEKKFDYYR